MSAIDIMTMPTLYASRVNSTLSHIGLIASSIASAVDGGSEDVYALIPDGDMDLARAILGLAQSATEYDAMLDGEVTDR
jgi:hypothetical protein